LVLPATLSVSAHDLSAPLFSIPADPSSLTATADSATAITVSWSDNSTDEDTFRIQRSPDGLDPWTEVGFVSADVTTFQDTGLTCNTQYYYRVIAQNVGGDSDYSNVDDATTSACPNPPAAPSGLTATVNSQTAITLDWADNSNNEDTFQI